MALLLHLLPAPVDGALYSKLWGRNGELWDPKGPLPDFSYAGEQAQPPVVACLLCCEAAPALLELPALCVTAALCAALPRPTGYKQGNEPLPVPPVTRSVLTFRKAGMSDTKMFKAALAWAHSRPVTDGEAALLTYGAAT